MAFFTTFRGYVVATSFRLTNLFMGGIWRMLHALRASYHCQVMRCLFVVVATSSTVPIPTSTPDTLVTYLYVTGGTSLAQAAALAGRHLGVCLDACHSAVEFEDPAEAWSLSSGGGPAEEGSDGGVLPAPPRLGYTLGKIQFSSALALSAPASDPEGRALRTVS